MKPGEQVCIECGLKDCTYVRPYFTPHKQYDMLFVGQAPGDVETITGQVFSGPAGKMEWRIMKEAGIDKRKVDSTNTAKCAPPLDRKPSPKEVALCRHFLKDDIHRSEPTLIIALGDTASKALTGKGSIQSIRGTMDPLDPFFEYDCMVLYSLHPSFCMRQRQWIQIAIQDHMKAVRYMATGEVEVAEHCEFITDFDEYQLQRYLEEASKRVTAIDTETTGLNPRKDRVIGASLCYEKNRAVAFDLNDNSPLWEPLKRWSEDKNAHKVMQNAQFDCAMLGNHDINTEGLIFDTRLAEHLLTSNLPASLDFLRSKYTYVKPYKPTKAEMKVISSWSAERRNEYACKDALVTFLVYEEQMNDMDTGNLTVMEEIEIPLVHAINAMEKKGVLVDQQKLAVLKKEHQPTVDRFIEEVFDPLDLNPNSSKQLKEFFGVASSNEETLKKCIKQDHEQKEVMQDVLDYRAAKKVLSVYVDGVLDRLEDGRIHTHFKIGGAGTGRLSSVDPNLQNVPKSLRAMYVPDHGFVFVDADYSQLEVRVLAVVAQVPLMLKEIAGGLNVHHEMCKIIFGKKWERLTDKQQVWTKNVVFGTAYGRGPTAISRQFGCTIKEATRWQELCLRKYPEFTTYHKNQEATFRKTNKAFNPFGRGRLITSVTQAYNTPIQSAGSDVCLKAIVDLHKAGFDLRLTVHDSITLQAPEKDKHDVAKEMQRIMEQPIAELDGMSFPVNAAIGNNWYDLEEIN